MNVNVVKPIYSITPFTLLDYPDKSACILWFAGCNMKCLYCYNPEIVFGKGKISTNEALKFLHSRKNLLDAVVFSGGECSLHNNLVNFVTEIQNMGFLVKIDTNGSSPKVIQTLIDENKVNYVALDFKSILDDFEKITQSSLFSAFEETLALLIGGNTPFEVRTTIHSNLFTEHKIQLMINYLEEKNYSGKYYLQFFRNDAPSIQTLPYSNRELAKANFASNKLQIVFRG